MNAQNPHCLLFNPPQYGSRLYQQPGGQPSRFQVFRVRLPSGPPSAVELLRRETACSMADVLFRPAAPNELLAGSVAAATRLSSEEDHSGPRKHEPCDSRWGDFVSERGHPDYCCDDEIIAPSVETSVLEPRERPAYIDTKPISANNPAKPASTPPRGVTASEAPEFDKAATSQFRVCASATFESQHSSRSSTRYLRVIRATPAAASRHLTVKRKYHTPPFTRLSQRIRAKIPLRYGPEGVSGAEAKNWGFTARAG